MRLLNPVTTDLATEFATAFTWPRRTFTPASFRAVVDDFDHVVDTFLSPTSATPEGFRPSCDVTEFKNHYLASFDMPGVKQNDIKIEVQGNRLVISGERQRTLKEGDEETTLRLEKSYGKFERTFVLPTSIVADKIEAHFENGVLNIALPKEELSRGRTIQVQTGQGGWLSKLMGSSRDSSRDHAKEAKDVQHS